MPLYKSLMLWILLLASSSSILALKYPFFLFLKCLLTSRLTQFKLSSLLWHGSCTHCIFARFLWSKKLKHSSSNQGLCCFHSCIPRLSFAEIWVLCLMFPQILFTSSSSFKFSKAANLFVISTWLLIKATNQNEENLILYVLFCYILNMNLSQCMKDGFVEFCNTDHLLLPHVPKLKISPLVETSQQNKLKQGYFSLCSWTLYVSQCSTMHKDAQMLPSFMHPNAPLKIFKYLHLVGWPSLLHASILGWTICAV